MSNLQRSSRWYVYELVDSRDGIVFYVGKGCGSRIDHHEKEALRGVRSRKTAKINEIRASGADVQKRQVAYFWDEQAAYDHETDHIEHFGLERLTNVLPGGQTAWDRRRTERASRKLVPFCPVDAVVRLAGHFAFWLVKTDAGRIQNSLVFTDNGQGLAKFRNAIADIAWRKMFPELWAKAIARPEDWPRLAKAFRGFGLELNFVEGA